jgi:hypothetical protein
MTLFVSRGLGLTWQAGLVTPVEAVPVVLEEGKTITLDNPNPTYDRWDLIVLRPNEFYDEYAQRSVRNRDGTLTVQNLPGIVNADATVAVVKGDPATTPVVPSADLGDIVVAAVYVRAGNPHKIEADDIYDTRIYLADTEGTAFEYYCTFQGGTSIAVLNEAVSSRNIRISSSLERLNTGLYHALLTIPRVFGSHPFEIVKVDNTRYRAIGVITASIEVYTPLTPRQVIINPTVHGQTASTLPFVEVEIAIATLDADLQRTDLASNEFCYLRAVFPRVD